MMLLFFTYFLRLFQRKENFFVCFSLGEEGGRKKGGRKKERKKKKKEEKE